MPASMAAASAWAAAHKVPLLASAGGGVVLLALHRRRAGAAGITPASPSPTSSTAAGASAQLGAYDSTASDVYDALQPQIEQTQTMLGQLIGLVTPKPSTPTPAPKPPTPAPKPPTPGRVPTPTPHAPYHPKGPVKPKTPPRPRVTRGSYTVRRGDSLSKIAARYRIDWHRLYEANRGTIGGNPNRIHAGQRLVIP